METKPYTASSDWHGGRIDIVRGDDSKPGFGIDQVFTPGHGPHKSTGGTFPLGYRQKEKDAIREARIHSVARGNCPIFLELKREG